MSRRDDLKKTILRHLLLHRRATRPELVALTGIRAATVFEAIAELKSARLVVEPERRGKRTGRRAPGLEIAPESFCTLGVELRPSGCIGVIIDGAGEELFSHRVSGESASSLEEVKCCLLSLLQNLREQAADDWKRVRGLGFADPGLVDVSRRFSIRAVNVPGWRDLETGKYLDSVSGLPAMVWPETMVKTRMEYLKLIDEAPESIFHLSTDGGIGGGFIKQGRLYIGHSGRAMEIGHLTVDPDGPRCRCGNRGCLEAVAGADALTEKLAAARRSGIDLGGMPERFSMADLAEFAAKNKGVRIIADELCRDVGQALSAVVMMLNPERIVISGEMTLLGDFLLDSLRRELELRCFPEALENLRLSLSRLSDTDTARGAALMMREKLLLES